MESQFETERLIIARFEEDDEEKILHVFGNEKANRFLPWFPIKTMEEAKPFLKRPWLEENMFSFWIYLKENGDSLPIGYVGLAGNSAHDLGYGLLPQYWNKGIMTEAAKAFVSRLESEGLPFITATHDVNNPASGRVMEKIGMTYRYSYSEHWMPKDIDVVFRMYQLDFSPTAETWTGCL